LADGTYSYYIVASYSVEDAPATKTVSITMAKKPFEGSFFEEFDYPAGNAEALKAAGWDVSANTINNSWYVKAESGFPPNAAFFLTPSGGEYSESLTSPYFDASESEDLYLSFLVVIAQGASPDAQKLAVEIFDGAAWTTLEDISSTGPWDTFAVRSYNVSPSAAGKDNIRIRFRCHGNATGEDLNWFLDNVELADANHRLTADDPAAVSANRAEDQTVHLHWADPNGRVLLRYVNNDEILGGIGNDGDPFIAANICSPEDLKAFDGYKLTSISFFRATSPAADTIVFNQPVFSGYASQGEGRLVNIRVENAPLGEWTTIELPTPITIEADKPRYYGVELVEHDTLDWPVGVGYSYEWDPVTYQSSPLFVADGRGNVYSEDGGATWNKLSDLDESLKYDLFHIRATLAQDPETPAKERIRGYRVFRNNVNLLGEGSLTLLNNFTDTIPLPADVEACYTVHAYYINRSVSEGITACITRINGIDPVNGENGVKVYPNHLKKDETITIDLSSDWKGAAIALYNLSGEKVKTIQATGPQIPVQLNVEPGVYFLKINNKNAVKLIVR
jgi:hypothetical protein